MCNDKVSWYFINKYIKVSKVRSKCLDQVSRGKYD